MRGASRESLAVVAERLDAVLRSAGSEATALGQQFFEVTSVLDSSASLRRSLTDPAREGNSKTDLVSRLLAGKVDERVLEAVCALVRGRWSDEWDLADAVERLGVYSVLTAAESNGELAQVEEDIFRFGRSLEASNDLFGALDDANRSDTDRARLVASLVDDKVIENSAKLIVQAAGKLRDSKPDRRLDQFSQFAADHSRRLVATVQSAVPVSQAQQERISALLERLYGRSVQLNLEVDPDVVGGLRIRVGDEVVDASVAARLEHVKRRFAG